MQGQYSLVVTTTDSADKARALASLLLENRLAACVQIYPVESHYVWQGKVESGEEYALHIKARTEDFAALCEAVKGSHDYEVPEIIRIDIADGHRPYLDWLGKETAR